MLNNFFKINMPYGIKVNEEGRWAAFNREYSPLGLNKKELNPYFSPFLFTKYKNLSDKLLLHLAGSEDCVHRNSTGNIDIIWFYNDATNPCNGQSISINNKNWIVYFKKIKRLSSLTIDYKIHSGF